MNFDGLFRTAETMLWAQSSLLVAVAYVRPPSLSGDSSIVEGIETIANCLALKGQDRVSGIGRPASEVQEFLIRASELTAILSIGAPRKGDYIVDSDQNTFAVYAAVPILGGRVWKLSVEETTDEDFGSIALVHTSSDDRGDLTPATAAEDFGPLYT